MPEPGRNLNLAESIAWAVERKAATTAYGPFEIRKELYDAAQRRHLQLEGGLTGFVCIDSWFRPFVATNCIHALSDLDLSPRLLVTGLAYGNKASFRVLRHYEPWIVNPQASHPWVGDVLGLYRHRVAFATAV
jgi:hypothetical protein